MSETTCRAEDNEEDYEEENGWNAEEGEGEEAALPREWRRMIADGLTSHDHR